MKTRQLQSNDAEAALQLVESFHGRDVSVSHMERFLSNTTNVLLVAEEGEEIIGFLSAHVLDSLEYESRAMFIYEIEVAESHQRQGVGTALIEHILRLADEQECFEAYVFTNHNNPPACAFYRATGGQIEGGDELMFVYPRGVPKG